ncbi:MAG: cation:proton antiporter, partial [Acidobacteriota bacterium]
SAGWAGSLLGQVDFNALVMQGMLSFLLFAGALHVDLGELLERKWQILSLATVGVILSTLLIGTLVHQLLPWLGLAITWGEALLFGALISPTDPIAVLGILRGARAPRNLQSIIVGESLFNDGVGVVVFTLLLGFAGKGHLPVIEAGELFLGEAAGGAVYGLLLGYVAFRLLRSVDNYLVEILITLALVAGGYALAAALHTSGPIAMVVAGLFIGNHGRVFAMSETTRQHLDPFWELIDEILNAVLFVLIGLELLVLDLHALFLAAGLVAILAVLASRFSTVAVMVSILRRFRRFGPHAVRLLTWAGVRGGISIALALSLPASPARPLIILMTYIVVVFSILVQGLTIGKAIRWSASRAA